MRGDLDEVEQILRAWADGGDRAAARRLAELLTERGDLKGCGPGSMPASRRSSWPYVPGGQPGVRSGGAICAGIGAGCIVGTAIEPVSWQPRSWTPWTGLAIGCNVAASAALIVAGWRHFTAARARRFMCHRYGRIRLA